jgi:hypothetical protein
MSTVLSCRVVRHSLARRDHAGDDDWVRGQLERDKQTVTIATALVLFILVLMLGGVIAVFAEWVGDLSTGVARFFSIATIAVASGISLRYLIRQRHP